MIEIYLLEQLCAFAECGTLSAAAEKLHISQPSLSRSMKKLEDICGVELFERNNSKISLNETGKLAAELAAEHLAQNESITARLKAYERSLKSIAVGSCAPFPMSEMMPILQEYFGSMRISSELAEPEVLEGGLLDHTYQLAVLNRPVSEPDFFCQRFLSEHLYIAVPKEHRLAKKEYVTYKDFAGEKFLLFEHIGFWKKMCHDKMTGATFLVQNSMDALFDLAGGSDFPCFTTDQFAKTAPEMPDRVFVPIEEPEAYATFYIACLNENKHKYASFFNAIRARSVNEN